ncbi:hypothetical protein GCM10018785_39570 [Streptomyces longispororuber]|uniref:DUF3558 domain-containing protein n=1 Tax=Streptomyces longispororuber TaxID=68230 RepID=A0A918ZT81_9ACTN|nr:DUF3558 domain-containing protein [Streptomyces longispororuber]GHE66858.1 hypothetical protein GCM10018785_39570 [Streptomyces longispororuber]
MQRRKVYAPGAAVLLVALLAGCTGDSGSDDGGDGKSGDTAGATAAAEPGKYRTLPEACGTVDRSALDAMLPGLTDVEDPRQREKAYEGAATVTYDTDRRVGCRWKVGSADATHHLLVDFERVVSYDGAVSDDARAQEVYRTKLREAGIPEPPSDAESEPEESEGSEDSESSEGSAKPEKSGKGEGAEGSKGSEPGPGKSSGTAAKPQGGKTGKSGNSGKADKAGKVEVAGRGDDAGSGDATDATDAADGGGVGDGGLTDGAAGATPAGLEPRSLDDLGDEAFLDDVLTTAASAGRHRTVTVVFRTSNVVVTVEYDEQPARGTEVPDSKEMQDNARELAESLVDEFDG